MQYFSEAACPKAGGPTALRWSLLWLYNPPCELTWLCEVYFPLRCWMLDDRLIKPQFWLWCIPTSTMKVPMTPRHPRVSRTLFWVLSLLCTSFAYKRAVRDAKIWSLNWGSGHVGGGKPYFFVNFNYILA